MNFQPNQVSAQRHVRMVEEIQALLNRELMYRTYPILGDIFPEEEGHCNDSRLSPRNVMLYTSSDQSSTNSIVKSMREKVCQWMYRVVDHFNYDRRVTFTA